MASSAAATRSDVLIDVTSESGGSERPRPTIVRKDPPSTLFQRSPVDAAGSGVGAHREAVRDGERLEIDLHHAVVVPQAEIRARSVGHHEDATVAGVAIGDLELFDLLACLGVHDDQRAGAAVENEHLAAV